MAGERRVHPGRMESLMAAEPDGRWIEVGDFVDARGNEKTRFMWAVESEFNRRWRLAEEPLVALAPLMTAAHEPRQRRTYADGILEMGNESGGPSTS